MRDIGLVAGMATAIGSLPHRDSRGAASLVLSCVPDLPAAPQLPHRTPLEGMISPWASAVPGVVIHADGTISLAGGVEIEPDTPLHPVFSSDMHGSLLTFLDVAAAHSPRLRRVKVQLTGPLTLGVALADAPASMSIAHGATITAPGLHIGARRADAKKIDASWPTDPVLCDLVLDGNIAEGDAKAFATAFGGRLYAGVSPAGLRLAA